MFNITLSGREYRIIFTHLIRPTSKQESPGTICRIIDITDVPEEKVLIKDKNGKSITDIDGNLIWRTVKKTDSAPIKSEWKSSIHPNDKFNRSLGRKAALAKSLVRIDRVTRERIEVFNKIERTLIWNKYRVIETEKTVQKLQSKLEKKLEDLQISR